MGGEGERGETGYTKTAAALFSALFPCLTIHDCHITSHDCHITSHNCYITGLTISLGCFRISGLIATHITACLRVAEEQSLVGGAQGDE